MVGKLLPARWPVNGTNNNAMIPNAMLPNTMLLTQRIAGVEKTLFFQHYPQCTVRLFEGVNNKRLVAYKTNKESLGYAGLLFNKGGVLLASEGEEQTLKTLWAIAQTLKIRPYNPYT